VYFPNHLANYLFTWPSLASALSGTLYTGGSMREWIENGRWRAGLLADFADHGYQVWQYDDRHHEAVNRDHFKPRPKRLSRINRRPLMLNMWVVRVTPTWLRQEVWRHLTENRASFLAAVSDLTVRSLAQLEELADDEVTRPPTGQCVFAHVYLPHQPHVFDGLCNELESEGPYLPQARCTLRPIARLIRILKAKETFERSTIVLFSDHGSTARGTRPYIDAARAAHQSWLREGVEVPALSRASALLVIKPPAHHGAGGFSESRAYTQNLDLAATVADLAGLGTVYEDGLAIFRDDFRPVRDIHLFADFESEIYHKVKRGTLPVDAIRGELRHFRFHPAKGWEQLANLPCVW
jgi:hypothetical protein